MAIVPLPLPPGAEARVLLRRLLAHRDVVGRDSAGRTIIQLAVDDWVLDKLATFERAAAALEHAGGEPGHAPWPPHPDRGGHLRWRGHHLHDELDAVPVTDLEPSGFATGQAREPDVAAAPPAAGRPLGDRINRRPAAAGAHRPPADHRAPDLES